ncbi:STAS domain-containing protein [Dactylosporangium sp. NPDC000244]|uniref:STAS domain-containing protein n=1 Tax=Dactylosporangium sp. NPDC000244 TaxID=3154365 RepID=UPI00333115E1
MSIRFLPLTVAIVPMRSASGVLRVAVAGDIDESTAPALRTALDDAAVGHPAGLEVDVAEVTHFSLAGLRVFDDVQRRLGGALVLLGVGRPVRRLLELQDRFGPTGIVRR